MEKANKPIPFKTFTKAVLMMNDLMNLITMPDDKDIEERKKIIGHLIDAQHTLMKINKKEL